MSTHRELMRRTRGERGAVLYLVAAMIVVFLGIAALAVDLGVWFVARSEAQRAAEAGAHAGASILMRSPNDEAGARLEAETFAESNNMRGIVPDVLPDDDIDVILDSQKVRVRVQRSNARGNPIGTMFAKAMGINTVDIGAVAAAQAWPGVATDCILPFAIPDRWMEWDPSIPGFRENEIGDVFSDPPDFYDPGPGGTGYAWQDVGQQITLTSASPGDSPQPGWYYAIAFPDTQGGNDYRDAINDCWIQSGETALGDEVDKEPGNMVGPTAQGFGDIFRDPNEQGQSWDPVLHWPVHSDGTPVSSDSRRMRPIVMFDPRVWEDIDLGRSPVEITNLAGIWMESWDGNNSIVVRWLHYTALVPADDWSSGGGALLRILRIVE
jgi:hypothetical protein